MKIVINIPEEMYKNLQKRSTELQAEGYLLENSVLNGTLLPKGHGRIIDEREITKCQQAGLYIIDGNISKCLITDAPTIIEADRAKNEE